MNARVHSERSPGDGLRRATGRDRDAWFAALDAWGAAGRPYGEIDDWLVIEHGLSSWWAQKLIVEYEQARGLRQPGVRPNGSFEVGASKTLAVPVERVFAAFVDVDLRQRWLPDAVMRERRSKADRLLHFDWDDGPSRVAVRLSVMGEAKTRVAIVHEGLADARSADQRKAYWRERLTALKALLES
jgi:hypothetical protein